MASTKIQNNILFLYMCVLFLVYQLVSQQTKIFKHVYNSKWLSVVRFCKNALYIILE